jgi:molybdate transport system ATP-binding protein
MLRVDVEKRLGEFALGVCFEAAGGATALFGPSGAGKTSVVNMIAGLLQPDRGAIALDDTVLFDASRGIDMPPHRRRIGYVFQEGRLFPHLSVRQNLDYGRRMNALKPDASEHERIAKMLDIGHLLDRRPGKLSGGERQRVAIARALVAHPACVLADEPTGNLDRGTADVVFGLMLRLAQERGTAFVMVTHDEQLAARCGRTLRLTAGHLSE